VDLFPIDERPTIAVYSSESNSVIEIRLYCATKLRSRSTRSLAQSVSDSAANFALLLLTKRIPACAAASDCELTELHTHT
jgi:hypothetical protein